MDQEQAGTAAVPCAGPEEGADGNAVGLPDLQPAVLDPPKQATHNTVREGRRGARLFRGGKSSIQDTHTQFTAIFSNGVSSQLPVQYTTSSGTMLLRSWRGLDYRARPWNECAAPSSSVSRSTSPQDG